WRPAENRMTGLFERIHEELGGHSWLIGRVPGSEYAKAQAYPSRTDQTYPRKHWFARRDATAYGIALDAQGKIAWGRSDIGGDPIIAVLTKQVTDPHLAGQPCASLPTAPPAQRRTPTGNPRVSTRSGPVRARHGLSAGERWIRTVGPRLSS